MITRNSTPSASRTLAFALAKSLYVRIIEQIVWPQVQGAVCQRGQRPVGELEPSWQLAETLRAVLLNGGEQRLEEISA
jgi:hypothetical protein